MVPHHSRIHKVDHIDRNHMDNPRSIYRDMGIGQSMWFDHGYRVIDIQLDHQIRYIQLSILHRIGRILLHTNMLHLWHYN